MTADSLWAALDCDSCDRWLVLSQLADWHRENGYNRDMQAGEDAAECLTWARDTKRWPADNGHRTDWLVWWANDNDDAVFCEIPHLSKIQYELARHLDGDDVICFGMYVGENRRSAAFRDLVRVWLAHPEARPVTTSPT